MRFIRELLVQFYNLLKEKIMNIKTIVAGIFTATLIITPTYSFAKHGADDSPAHEAAEHAGGGAAGAGHEAAGHEAAEHAAGGAAGGNNATGHETAENEAAEHAGANTPAANGATANGAASNATNAVKGDKHRQRRRGRDKEVVTPTTTP
jgi:hypothetical protein